MSFVWSVGVVVVALFLGTGVVAIGLAVSDALARRSTRRAARPSR